jgi:hypothetical protein
MFSNTLSLCSSLNVRDQVSHPYITTHTEQPPAHAGSSLVDFSTLKMEAIHSSETSVHTKSTRRHIPEDGILHSHHRGNLKSYKFSFVTVPKYLNCATFSKDLLAIFMLWFCPAFWWCDSNIYVVWVECISAINRISQSKPRLIVTVNHDSVIMFQMLWSDLVWCNIDFMLIPGYMVYYVSVISLESCRMFYVN